MQHTPVLQNTILDLLAPKKGETVIDVTVGLGGHAKGFLERIGPKGRIIGIDADEENLRAANDEMRKYENVQLIHANFRECFDSAQHDRCHLPPCDIVFADLGLSSPHLDDPSRGFSFRGEGPLDCRFDRTKGRTAAEILAESCEERLARTFGEYGELRGAGHLASFIVKQRAIQPIRLTQDLAKVVTEFYGWRAKSLLPQVFQALRIAVNDELAALQTLLEEGPKLLKAGGRMGMISYHSLEDRMVKERFRALTAAHTHPVTGAPLDPPPPFVLLTPRPLKPTLREIGDNPRARSACFRALRRISSPW